MNVLGAGSGAGIAVRALIVGAWLALYGQQLWLHAAPVAARAHDLTRVLADHLGESLLYHVVARTGSHARTLAQLRLSFLPDEARHRVTIDAQVAQLADLPGLPLLAERLGAALSGPARVHVEASFDANARWLGIEAKGSAIGTGASLSATMHDEHLLGAWRASVDDSTGAAIPLSIPVTTTLAAELVCLLTFPAGLRAGERWSIPLPALPGVGARSVTATVTGRSSITVGDLAIPTWIIALSDGATPSARVWCDDRGTLLRLAPAASDDGLGIELRQRLGGSAP